MGSKTSRDCCRNDCDGVVDLRLNVVLPVCGGQFVFHIHIPDDEVPEGMELENEIRILKKSFKDNEELITQQLELEYLSLQMREILENLS